MYYFVIHRSGKLIVRSTPPESDPYITSEEYHPERGIPYLDKNGQIAYKPVKMPVFSGGTPTSTEPVAAPLQAQIDAVVAYQEFLEDCIAEMATVVYNN